MAHSSVFLVVLCLAMAVPAWAASRASLASSGEQADRISFDPTLDATGKLVVFSSRAKNLVPGDSNHEVSIPGTRVRGTDVFLRNTATSTTERISTQEDGSEVEGDSEAPAISTDARFVAFQSSGRNLSPGLGQTQIYLKDRQNGALGLVSKAPDGSPGNAASVRVSLSGDGRIVAFDSESTNLSASPSDGTRSVYIVDVADGVIHRLSSGIGQASPNGPSAAAAVSQDGSRVAFVSAASNLVDDDTNSVSDVFIVEIASGGLTRISAAAIGGAASRVALSANGCVVAFSVIDDATQIEQLAIWTCDEPTPRLLGEGMLGGDGAVSADGRYVAFAQGQGGENAFVLDRSADVVTLLSKTPAGLPANARSYQATVSSDGSVFAFTSDADDLVGSDTNNQSDVFTTTLDALCQDADSCTTDHYEDGSCVATALVGTALVECELAAPWPTEGCSVAPASGQISRLAERVRALSTRFVELSRTRRQQRVGRKAVARIRRLQRALARPVDSPSPPVCIQEIGDHVNELREALVAAMNAPE